MYTQFGCSNWDKNIKTQERKIEREERLSRTNMNIIRDNSIEPDNNLVKQNQEEVGETVEQTKDINTDVMTETIDTRQAKAADDKEMEEMNKSNKVIKESLFSAISFTFSLTLSSQSESLHQGV